MVAEATVFIVDDDDDLRESLLWLMRSVRLPVKAYPSAAEFRKEYSPDAPGCLILDVRMPETSGMELFEQLTAEGSRLPVIFITAHADVPTVVRAFKTGAAEFLEKPFDRQALLERVRRAMRDDVDRRAQTAHWGEIRNRMAELSPRERQVLRMLLEGTPNKTIATKLCITERAVEMRRSTMMKKLQVSSVAELVRVVTEFEMLEMISDFRKKTPGT
jgi:FixJ family two-component response regulator